MSRLASTSGASAYPTKRVRNQQNNIFSAARRGHRLGKIGSTNLRRYLAGKDEQADLQQTCLAVRKQQPWSSGVADTPLAASGGLPRSQLLHEQGNKTRSSAEPSLRVYHGSRHLKEEALSPASNTLRCAISLLERAQAVGPNAAPSTLTAKEAQSLGDYAWDAAAIKCYAVIDILFALIQLHMRVPNRLLGQVFFSLQVLEEAEDASTVARLAWCLARLRPVGVRLSKQWQQLLVSRLTRPDTLLSLGEIAAVVRSCGRATLVSTQLAHGMAAAAASHLRLLGSRAASHGPRASAEGITESEGSSDDSSAVAQPELPGGGGTCVAARREAGCAPRAPSESASDPAHAAATATELAGLLEGLALMRARLSAGWRADFTAALASLSPAVVARSGAAKPSRGLQQWPQVPALAVLSTTPAASVVPSSIAATVCRAIAHDTTQAGAPVAGPGPPAPTAPPAVSNLAAASLPATPGVADAATIAAAAAAEADTTPAAAAAMPAAAIAGLICSAHMLAPHAQLNTPALAAQLLERLAAAGIGPSPSLQLQSAGCPKQTQGAGPTTASARPPASPWPHTSTELALRASLRHLVEATDWMHREPPLSRLHIRYASACGEGVLALPSFDVPPVAVALMLLPPQVVGAEQSGPLLSAIRWLVAEEAANSLYGPSVPDGAAAAQRWEAPQAACTDDGNNKDDTNHNVGLKRGSRQSNKGATISGTNGGSSGRQPTSRSNSASALGATRVTVEAAILAYVRSLLFDLPPPAFAQVLQRLPSVVALERCSTSADFLREVQFQVIRRLHKFDPHSLLGVLVALPTLLSGCAETMSSNGSAGDNHTNSSGSGSSGTPAKAASVATGNSAQVQQQASSRIVLHSRHASGSHAPVQAQVVAQPANRPGIAAGLSATWASALEPGFVLEVAPYLSAAADRLSYSERCEALAALSRLSQPLDNPTTYQLAWPAIRELHLLSESDLGWLREGLSAMVLPWAQPDLRSMALRLLDEYKPGSPPRTVKQALRQLLIKPVPSAPAALLARSGISTGKRADAVMSQTLLLAGGGRLAALDVDAALEELLPGKAAVVAAVSGDEYRRPEAFAGLDQGRSGGDAESEWDLPNELALVAGARGDRVGAFGGFPHEDTEEEEDGGEERVVFEQHVPAAEQEPEGVAQARGSRGSTGSTRL